VSVLELGKPNAYELFVRRLVFAVKRGLGIDMKPLLTDLLKQ